MADSRLEADEEVLQGTDSWWERLAARPGVVRWLVAGVVVALTVALTVVHLVRPGVPTSRFAASVVGAEYSLPPTGGIDSTLTIGNPTGTAVTLTGVSLGNPSRDAPAAGSAIVVLGLSPGGRQTVTVRVHSDFDCAAGHPALPAAALLTGADSRGRVGTVEVPLPGSERFATAQEGFRDRVCGIPYPLTLLDVGYSGIGGVEVGRSSGRFQMDLVLSFADGPGAVPVRAGHVGSTISGVKIAAAGTDPGSGAGSATDPVTLRPGEQQAITVTWTVGDCGAVPRYYGIPSVTVTGSNLRATETREYALGAKFDHDLAGALAAICPTGAH